MMNCKDVSEKISLAMDQTLPIHQRLMIRMHVLMCNCCTAVEAQLKWLRQVAQMQGPEPEPENDLEAMDIDGTLSEDAKGKIKVALEKAVQETSTAK